MELHEEALKLVEDQVRVRQFEEVHIAGQMVRMSRQIHLAAQARIS